MCSLSAMGPSQCCLLKTDQSCGLGPALFSLPMNRGLENLGNLPKVSEWQSWGLNSGQKEGKTHAGNITCSSHG